MISFSNISLQFGDRVLFTDVNFTLFAKQKVGITGANGSGKSSFFKLLLNELTPDSGQITQPKQLIVGHVAQEMPMTDTSAIDFSFLESCNSPALLLKLSQAEIGYGDNTILHEVNLRIDAGVRIGYYAQHQLEQLVAEQTPLQHLQQLAPNATDQQLRNFLGGFGFSNDTALTPIASFSGGEKARLVLALIVWRKPNLLLLDELTNHLDLEMRSALTFALQDYQGAVVVVSHNRHLLRSTVEQFLLVAHHKVSEFNGDLDDYQQWLIDFKQTQKSQPTVDKNKQKQDRRQQREQTKQLALRIKQLEKAINNDNTELLAVEQHLASAELYQAARRDQLDHYLSKQTSLRQQLSEAETEWLALCEQLEDN